MNHLSLNLLIAIATFLAMAGTACMLGGTLFDSARVHLLGIILCIPLALMAIVMLFVVIPVVVYYTRFK